MILVYLENNLANLPKYTLATIAAALEIKKAHNYSKVVVLVLGSESTDLAANKAAK